MTIKMTITLETTIDVQAAETQKEAENRIDNILMVDESEGFGVCSVDLKALEPVLQDTDLITWEYDKVTTHKSEFVFDGKSIHRATEQ
ncbi:MAG: hypothetical protein SPL45_07395 [Schwartzia succinivorans]|nr:hypothetical protein [Schwartzia succinivorans]